MSDSPLAVIEQKEVLFQEDKIIAVRAEDGVVYVPLRPICGLLDLNWSGQRQRAQRNPVLSSVLKECMIHSINPRRASLCLPLDYLNGWLFGVDVNRVQSELKERVIRYQHDCYRVLFEAFQEGQLSTDPRFAALLDNTNSEAVQAYTMLQALVKMARQQIILEARIGVHDEAIASNTQRIEDLEIHVGENAITISTKQATHISQAVKAIALELGKRSGRNEFQGVYGELYRRFEIPSYRELPSTQYNEAMSFLRDWWQSLTDSSNIPF